MGETLRFEGTARPQDIRRSPYLYIPFPVSANTTRLQVSYNYSDPVTAAFGLGPGNTVDIGIFDPRGIGFIEPNGFRGWSGSAKRTFFIAPQEATPGYIHGPLLPGQWNIVLGFDRIQEQGVRYEVKIDLSIDDAGDSGEGSPGAWAASSLQRAPGPIKRPRGGRPSERWLKGDLHCHSLHSDGLNTVEELALNAVERGLDFLAVTDHNTNAHHDDLTRLAHLPIVLIPGEEVTTPWGHANMWGLRQWVEFRCPDEESMRAVQRWVLNKGGLISINHPKSIGLPWLFQDLGGYPCLEVWHAPWRFYNWESLEFWDGLLRGGQRVVAVGGSDVHSIPPARPLHPQGLGNPTTWVYVQGAPTEKAILDAIRRGHVFISDNPGGPQLILRADADGDGKFEKLMGDTVEAVPGQRVNFRVQVVGGSDRRLRLLGDGLPIDIVPLTRHDTRYDFSLELSGRRYVRAELRGYRGRPERGEVIWAMSNPIWLKTREAS